MHGQLEHLVSCCKQPNITLQVMRFGGGYAPEGGAFSILRFAEPELPDVVYQEQLAGAMYLDKRSDVDLPGCAGSAVRRQRAPGGHPEHS